MEGQMYIGILFVILGLVVFPLVLVSAIFGSRPNKQ